MQYWSVLLKMQYLSALKASAFLSIGSLFCPRKSVVIVVFSVAIRRIRPNRKRKHFGNCQTTRWGGEVRIWFLKPNRVRLPRTSHGYHPRLSDSKNLDVRTVVPRSAHDQFVPSFVRTRARPRFASTAVRVGFILFLFFFFLPPRQIARWARVGGFDANAENTYHIVERTMHPDYKPPSLYNDVALFKLSADVVFSSSAMPVCLNWDPLRIPAEQTATGRETELSPGQCGAGVRLSSILLLLFLIPPSSASSFPTAPVLLCPTSRPRHPARSPSSHISFPVPTISLRARPPFRAFAPNVAAQPYALVSPRCCRWSAERTNTAPRFSHPFVRRPYVFTLAIVKKNIKRPSTAMPCRHSNAAYGRRTSFAWWNLSSDHAITYVLISRRVSALHFFSSSFWRIFKNLFSDICLKRSVHYHRSATAETRARDHTNCPKFDLGSKTRQGLQKIRSDGELWWNVNV